MPPPCPPPPPPLRACAAGAATSSVAAARSATIVDVFMASPPGAPTHNTDHRRRLRTLWRGSPKGRNRADEHATACGQADAGALQARAYAMIHPTVSTYIP